MLVTTYTILKKQNQKLLVLWQLSKDTGPQGVQLLTPKKVLISCHFFNNLETMTHTYCC